MSLSLRNFTSRLAFIVALALASGSVTAYAESRAYQLNNRPADDVAAQIRELYQGESLAVTARGQQIVVRGTQQMLDEIGTLVIDVPHMQQITKPLYAANNVEQLGFFSAAIAKAKLFIAGGK